MISFCIGCLTRIYLNLWISKYVTVDTKQIAFDLQLYHNHDKKYTTRCGENFTSLFFLI